jgi:hypothetical protein
MAVTQLRGINPTRGRHGNSTTPETIHNSKGILSLQQNQYRDTAKLAAETAFMVAGTLSMAAGEYISVISQTDTEPADLELEKTQLDTNGEAEKRELAAIYVRRGIETFLAQTVAHQLMAHDALGAHARDEIGLPVSCEICRRCAAADPYRYAVTTATNYSYRLLYLASLPRGPRLNFCASGGRRSLDRRCTSSIMGGIGHGSHSRHWSDVRKKCNTRGDSHCANCVIPIFNFSGNGLRLPSHVLFIFAATSAV